QAVGKVPVNLSELPIDALAFSGHKLYGPKGVGGLFLRRKKPRVAIQPLLYGGGQEKGKRSGTLNVPGIAGMAKAIMLSQTENTDLEILRDTLEQGLFSINSNFIINGDTENRLKHVSNISLKGIKAEHLLIKVNHELCFSLGSACTAVRQGPS